MSVLSYKTRAGASVRDIPKVYFCCHFEDFDLCFEEILSELLEIQNCSVWYHANKAVEYDEDFYEDLRQMHLFVVPVTGRFLQAGNDALEKEFRFAVENHIPILPLIQENGIENRFNEVCGNIQFLDKYSSDRTGIDYSTKLQKFLNAVLVEDVVVQKIRKAFNGSIFLSYRKKDRRHAQQLMKLIHQNKFCRDVAIWYDEFLVPGENFNSGISEALQKSDLVVLAVTPNLINEKNYVMDVEYPMAKKCNKAILPCEMVETDMDLLAKSYNDIPVCANGRDLLSLSVCLRQHFWDLARNGLDNSPEHLFYIGLAYLNGIDVEVDRRRALSLITMAAEQKHPEAITQLINMYVSGDGVEADRNEAFQWRKRLLDITHEIYENEKTYANGFAWMRACFELANAAQELNLHEAAIEAAQLLKRICTEVVDTTECSEFERLDLRRFIALADLTMGQAYQDMDAFDTAQELYEQSFQRLQKINITVDEPAFLSDMAALYSNYAMLLRVKAQYDQSIEYYKKALRIQQRLLERYGGEMYLAAQTIIFGYIGSLLLIKGDTKGALEYCIKALRLLDELEKNHGENAYLYNRINTLHMLAEAYRLESDFPKALKVFDQLAMLEKRYNRRHGELSVHTRVATQMTRVQIYFQMCDFEAVIQYGEQLAKLMKDSNILTHEHIARGNTNYSVLYFYIGASYFNGRGDVNAALRNLKQSVDLGEEYIKRGILNYMCDCVIVLSLYGDILQIDGNLSLSRKNLDRGASLYEKYLSGEDSLRNLCAGAAVYAAIGENHVYKEQIPEAIRFLKKAESLFDKALSMYPYAKPAIQRDCIQVMYDLVGCYNDEDDAEQAKVYCLKCIEMLDFLGQTSYFMDDWSKEGIVCYLLSEIVSGVLQRQRWRNRMLAAVQQIKQLYPTKYTETMFYSWMSDTGIFD